MTQRRKSNGGNGSIVTPQKGNGGIVTHGINGTPVWVRAIRQLMTARGYHRQAALIAAANARGIHLRPNTVSAALRDEQPPYPALETLMALAAALDVPLGALFQEQPLAAVEPTPPERARDLVREMHRLEIQLANHQADAMQRSHEIIGRMLVVTGEFLDRTDRDD